MNLKKRVYLCSEKNRTFNFIFVQRILYLVVLIIAYYVICAFSCWEIVALRSIIVESCNQVFPLHRSRYSLVVPDTRK